MFRRERRLGGREKNEGMGRSNNGGEGGRDLRQRKIFRERAGKRGVLIEE